MKKLAHFIGMLVAAKPAVPTAPLLFHALQHLKISSLHQTESYQASVQLSPEAEDNLIWWRDHIQDNCSAPILGRNASVIIESDASKIGWGAVCQGVRTGGKWTATEAELHINVLEMKAAWLAMQCFLKDTHDVAVLLRMDNWVAIAHLNKIGGPTLSPLSQMALKVWEWCQLQRISPHAKHLPSKENVLADWESWHTCDSSDWKLPLVFKSLQNFSYLALPCEPVENQTNSFTSCQSSPSFFSTKRLSVSK